jgi:hypothetical protein
MIPHIDDNHMHITTFATPPSDHGERNDGKHGKINIRKDARKDATKKKLFSRYDICTKDEKAITDL